MLFAGGSEVHILFTCGPRGCTVEGVGLIDERILVHSDRRLYLRDDRRSISGSNEEVVSFGETELIVGVVGGSVARIFIHRLDLLTVEVIVRHLHGVLDAVRLVILVVNLLKVVLSERLVASAVVVGSVLSTPVSLIDVFQVGGEERLNVEVEDVRLRAHIGGDLHGELVVVVSRVG